VFIRSDYAEKNTASSMIQFTVFES